MSINRRLRRNNNVAGLRAQLQEKEQEIFRLNQQMEMQNMYFQEVTKVTTALKDMYIEKTGIDEDALMDKVDEHLKAVEAAELDAEIKSEESEKPEETKDVTEIDTDNTELEKAIEFVEEDSTETPIEEVIAEAESKPTEKAEEEAPKKAKKTRKKKEDKE